MSKFIGLCGKLTVATALAGCASIASVSDSSNDSTGGLVYYMPNKAFVITLTVSEGFVTTILIETSLPYPDLSKKYVLQHSNGIFAKNVLDVEITNGLLTSTKSSMTSGVSDALKNLAGSIGAANFRSKSTKPADEEKKSKCADGTHKFIFESEVNKATPCDAEVTISRISETKIPSAKTTEGSHSGVFYRVNEPYLITVIADKTNAQAVLFSPSSSPTYFLPVGKTFFANNDASFTFDGGVPTKYKQDTDSEAVALFKIPADILSSYFAAVGALFTSFKTNDTAQSDALAANIKLELMKKKYDACILAIESGDPAQISALGCGD